MNKTIQNIFLSFTLILFLCDFSFSQTGWFQQNSSTNKNLYSVQFLDINTGYACGLDSFGSNILKTTNGGLNWLVIHFDSYSNFYSISFIDINTGYVAGGNSSNTGVIKKTTNGGTNWSEQITNVFYIIRAITIIPQTGGNVCFCTGFNGTISKTTNGGINWYLLTSGIVINLYSIYFNDINTGYVVGDANTVLKTTDSGQDWIDLSVYPRILNFRFVTFVNAVTGYISSADANEMHNLGFKTTNSGIIWTSRSNGGGNSINFPITNIGYVVGSTGYIAKSINGGENWYQQTSGTTRTLHSVFFMDANTGWAVGDSGTILKTTNGGGPIGIRPISNEVPKSFQLFQNYPNPFNPSTKIRFTIALSPLSERGAGGFTNLTIYDILGREVAVLVNERFSPGTYEVNWDAGNYPSGVYFYRFTAGDFTDCKRMVLIK